MDEYKPSTSTVIYQNFNNLLGELKLDKPNDRSELDRRYAIVITDLEKIAAYYKVYIKEN